MPRESWEMITIDFIGGLPQSGHANCIFVLVDKLTKFVHFLPLAHPYTAAKVVVLYMHRIYPLHGFHGAIISDRDPVFTSHFWQELIKFASMELCMSTANHPQTDGQTERINQSLETFLRCFTHACPRRWSHRLPLAQFWYNSADHSAIGMSSFREMYGHEPRHWGITTSNCYTVPALQSWLDEHTVIQDLLQQHLQHARLCMKQNTDKKRSFRAFEVGNTVFLKLQPYVQTSVARCANHKLSFRYYGSYPIVEKINEVAYKLLLPEHAKVHPVFHVS